MAIGAITVGAQGGQSASTPLRAIPLSFAGDGAYPTGGTADFEGSVRTQLGEDVTLIDIIPGDCGDNKPEYDRTNDKLKVRVISTAAEVANATDLSGTTFNMTALCK